MGHIFQLGRKYAEALGLQGAGPERQAGHGHHGLLRGRGVPRRRRGRRGHLRREGSVLAAGARAVRRADRWPPARTRRCARAAADLACELDEAGVVGAAGRPQGQPGGEVRRRRDPGHADHRGGRPRTGRRRGRAARPARAASAASVPVDDALGRDRGRRARLAQPSTELLASSSALTVVAAGAGRLRGRLGGRGGRRRRADPAAGAADRAARLHAAGRRSWAPTRSPRCGGPRPARSRTRSRSDPTGAPSCRWSSAPRSAPRWAPSWPGSCPGTCFTPIVLVALVVVGIYTWRRPELGPDLRSASTTAGRTTAGPRRSGWASARTTGSSARAPARSS